MIQKVEGGELEAMASKINAELKKSLDDRDSALVERLQRQFQEELAKKSAEFESRVAKFSLPGSEDATHKGKGYSFAKAMLGVLTKDMSVCPLEHAMHNEVRAKAMSFGVDTAGGFLVPNEVLTSQLIPLLYANTVCVELGATRLDGLTRAPIQIPRVGGGTTAYWIGETGTITASDAAVEQVQLMPHGLAAMTVVSELLLGMDSPGVESMLREDMARQMALKLDLAALAGTGASGQPTGILTASGVNTTTLSDPGTYNQYAQFISEVRADNALAGRLGWAVSNADMAELEQIVDTSSGGTNTTNQIHERRRLLSEDGSELLGYPVRVSTQLSDGQVIFGNFADLVIAQWGGMKIDTTNAVNFASAQQHIRALSFFDIGIRHPQSFCRPS
jgi:HK97 family phage major capsid protein